jgi:hypothetical protein
MFSWLSETTGLEAPNTYNASCVNREIHIWGQIFILDFVLMSI